MINLNATTKSLEVLLSGSITTNQLTIVSSYVDIDQTAITVSTIGENDTVTNNTTAVTAVAAPASGMTRKIKSVTVQNTDTVSALVTVRVNNNSTFRVGTAPRARKPSISARFWITRIFSPLKSARLAIGTLRVWKCWSPVL